MIHSEHIYKANFPTDGKGHLCGVDYPDHNFIYLSDLNDIVIGLIK